MGYILTFIAGGMFGIIFMSIFAVSGNESRKEERRELKDKI